jgi:hypothetical protein
MTNLTPSLIISSNQTIERRRELPIEGEVLVAVGHKLKGDDLVAKAELKGELKFLRIAEELQLSVNDALKGIIVKEGDRVVRGDTIYLASSCFGLLKQTLSAPIDGVVEVISQDTGRVAIREASHQISLNAFIAGEVKEIIEKRGVVISSQITQIQGAFGVGREKIGRLRLLEMNDSELIDHKLISKEDYRAILVGGSGVTEEALKLADEVGVYGIMTGSITDRILRNYLGYDLRLALTGDEDLPVTLVVSEGFGKLSLNQRIREILKNLDGEEASLSAATQVRAGAKRPELLVRGKKVDIYPEENIKGDKNLNIGSKVRIIRHPYFGVYGEVVELPNALELLPSQAKTRVARIKLDGTNEIVTVSRSNIEL